MGHGVLRASFAVQLVSDERQQRLPFVRHLTREVHVEDRLDITRERLAGARIQPTGEQLEFLDFLAEVDPDLFVQPIVEYIAQDEDRHRR